MKQLCIVLFSATNCSYCPAVKNSLEEIAVEKGNLVNLKIHVIDQNPAAMRLAKEWQVRGVPYILFLINGQEYGNVVGSITKERLGDLIERIIQSEILPEQSGGSESSSDSVLRNTSEPSNDGTGSN